MIKKIAALAIMTLSVLSFSSIALAANGEGFTLEAANPNTINPRKFIFELRPGEKAEDYIEISNLSDEEETFLLYGADPTFSAQGTPAYKTRQAGGNGEGQWIQFDQSELTLQPKETKLVKFTVNIPPEAALGEYRAGITMERAPHASSQPGISIATRIILHAEIKVTKDPKAIPKQDGSFLGGHGAPDSTDTEFDWRTLYFWISLTLFIASFLALLWITLNERKGASALKMEQPVEIKETPAPKKTTKKSSGRKKSGNKTRGSKSQKSSSKSSAKHSTARKKTSSRKSTKSRTKTAPKKKSTTAKKKSPTRKKSATKKSGK